MEPVGPIAGFRYGRCLACVINGHGALVAGDGSSGVEILTQR